MSFTDAEIDAAIAALSDPGRLDAAQSLVSRAAPSLQRVLGSALNEGGWFDTAHEAAVKEAIGAEHAQDRIVAVRTLLAEETRLTMLVGVAVGFELARELGHAPADAGSAGAHSAGAHSAGAHSAGAHSAGARPAGARPAEAHSAEARSAGARSAGARSDGARSDTATDQEDQ